MNCCKVGNLIEQYNITSASNNDDVQDYLVQRWVGRGDYTPTGLRPLKNWLNKQAMKTAYTNNNRDTFDSRIDSEYEAITGEDVDFAILEDMSSDGVDTEQLRSDFISTATLYRHLTSCLDVNKSSKNKPASTEWEQDKIDYAKTVVEQSLEESLQSLDNKGKLPGASQATITTEVIVGCPECNTRVGFERAVARGYICRDHLG